MEGGREVISQLVPDPPLLDGSATDLGTQARVGPGEVVRPSVLSSKLCGVLGAHLLVEPMHILNLSMDSPLIK